MNPVVRSIAEIPFVDGPALAVLHLLADRATVDEDYVGFGHCRVDEIELVGRGGTQSVRDARVLALHCTEPGEALSDDVELEFVLGSGPAPASVSARLSRFLAVWLPRIVRDERAVVLALCNPYRARLTLPAMLAPTNVPLYYGEGSVESWYDRRVRLVAERWHVARA